MSQKPINAGIVGWLSSLGLKQSGQNPIELGDQVTPTLDLQPFYQLANEETFTFSGSIVFNYLLGVYPVPGATIPQGEIWAISSMTAIIGFGAGQAQNLSATVGYGEGSTTFYGCGNTGYFNSPVATTRPNFIISGIRCEKPLLLRNPCFLGIHLGVDEPTGGTKTVTFSAKLRRFQI